MTSISGKKKEFKESDFHKYVGVGEFEVIGVNPDAEQFQELTGIEPKENSRQFEYLGESEEGHATVRLTLYLKEVKSAAILNVSFFLEERTRTNKDETKTQWINATGQTAWAEKEEQLLDWFTKRDFRKAIVGEEELYSFLRAWLGGSTGLDFSDPGTTLQIDLKKLFRGNVKDILEQINGEYAGHVLALATIKNKEVDGETKTFQVVNNRNFLPGYALKNFKGKKFTQKEAAIINAVLSGTDRDAKKKIKATERFVAQVLDPEHGVKEFFGGYLGTIREYNPEEDVTASNAVISESEDEDASY